MVEVDSCLSCNAVCTPNNRCRCCLAKRLPGWCKCPQGPSIGLRRSREWPRCKRCSQFVGEVALKEEIVVKEEPTIFQLFNSPGVSTFKE